MTNPTLGQRILDKTVTNGVCLFWCGATDPAGYPRIRVNGRLWRVHLLLYQQAHGPVPPGHVVVRTCNTRACIAPDHLLAMPKRDVQSPRDPRRPVVEGMVPVPEWEPWMELPVLPETRDLFDPPHLPEGQGYPAPDHGMEGRP